MGLSKTSLLILSSFLIGLYLGILSNFMVAFSGLFKYAHLIGIAGIVLGIIAFKAKAF
jgi:hypothetical protein